MFNTEALLRTVKKLTVSAGGGVARSILRQIGGAGRVKAMLGVKQFVAGDNSLSFRFKARASNGANHIQITLDPTDTYTVQFGRVRGLNFKVISTKSGVYSDQLRAAIESETGLYLSL